MAIGDPERLDEVLELAHEEGGRPELGAPVGIVGAAAASDLVVVDDGTRAGEVGE